MGKREFIASTTSTHRYKNDAPVGYKWVNLNYTNIVAGESKETFKKW